MDESLTLLKMHYSPYLPLKFPSDSVNAKQIKQQKRSKQSSRATESTTDNVLSLSLSLTFFSTWFRYWCFRGLRRPMRYKHLSRTTHFSAIKCRHTLPCGAVLLPRIKEKRNNKHRNWNQSKGSIPITARDCTAVLVKLSFFKNLSLTDTTSYPLQRLWKKTPRKT